MNKACYRIKHTELLGYGFILVYLMLGISCATHRMESKHKKWDLVEEESRACVNNLKQIQGAKQQFALEHNLKQTYPSPPFEEIAPYLRYPEQVRACPSNHEPYNLGVTIGDLPSCPNYSPGNPRFSGHVLAGK